MENSQNRRFPGIIAALVARQELTQEQMESAFEEILAGRLGDIETAAFLVGLRTKGETEAELAAGAKVIRSQMVRLETGRDDVLDTCGTGGDGTGTLNISTAAGLVAASAGVPVVKHGNSAVSSKSGSADVLASLGVCIDGDAGWAKQSLERTGWAFCFAPSFHPALKRVAAVRKRLGFGTIFNSLGPLANPACAPYQVIGVGRRDLLAPIAGALVRLGSRHALVVNGADGLDEVSLAGPTRYMEIRNGKAQAGEWTPDDFGLAPCGLDEMRVSGAEESAALIRKIFEGQEGPAARVIIANAAAALVAADRVQSLREGVERATETIRRGRAIGLLEQLIWWSKERQRSGREPDTKKERGAMA
jgi:anthranilate phosphoribosyltransferase